MLRNTLLLVLVVSLLHTGVAKGFAGSDEDESRGIAKAKAQVAKRGTGEKARVTVKLRDQKEVKGFVAQAGDDDFVVADGKTGARTTIAYREVSDVKARKFPLAAKIGIGVGVGAVVLALVALHSIRNIGY